MTADPTRLFTLRFVAAVATCAAMLLSACAIQAPQPPPAHRTALVIGNSTYQVFDPIPNPVHDALDTCAALRRVGFRVSCFTDVKDQREFMAIVARFVSTLDADSESLFYYAGHAIQIGGENYLIPTAAYARSKDDIEHQFVGLDRVLDEFRTRPGAFQMVVLDACRDAPKAAPRPQDLPVLATRSVVLPDATYGLRPIKSAPAGSIVFYATASGDSIGDGLDRNGVLTKHILANLEMAGLPVEALLKRVIEGVMRDTRGSQVPYVYSSYPGTFCFAGCSGRPGDVVQMKRELNDFSFVLQRSGRAPPPAGVFVIPTP